MYLQYTPFLLPLLAAALISAMVGVFAYRHREVPAARSFVVVMACSAGWSLFYGLYQAATRLSGKELFAALLQAAAIGMPVAWFVFAARYAELRRAHSRRAVAALSLVPLFTLALVVTNDGHGWFWSRFALETRGGRVGVDSAPGWGFWLHVAYSWLLMSATVVLLLGKVLRARHRARAQSAAVLFGALVPWVGNVLHLSGVVRLPANPMPFLFTLSGLAFAFAIFRFRFLDVLPVARETVIDEMADGVVVLDPAGRVADLNPSARRILGIGGASPVGRPGAEVLGKWGLLADGEGEGTPAATQVEVGEGKAKRSYDVRATRLTDRSGAYAGRVVVLRDVTERARMEEQLRRSAFYDGLTGLANRALFHDRLRQAVERGRRGKTFAVLFLDLDRFKIVNDSLGHHVGDELLVAVSRRLESCLRPGDTVARLGGDEFAILVEEVGGADEAVAVADRIQAVMAQPVLLDGHDVVPSASIGVVMGSELEAGAEHLLRFADVAMYRAKARGRGRAEVFDPEMHENVVARMRLETDLRRALERGELRVLYQPIVELSTGRTAAMEALLRWEHPERGLLRPADFMRVAEETGMISAIGEWVLREAAGQLGAWQRALGTPLVMSVNVSTREISDPGFVERVEALLRETAPAPDTLRVEIPESAIMRNADAVIGVLERLEALGVRCYMDDFGIGYSSLSYLHRFPVNVMKVDRIFVERLPAESDAVEIVRTLVTLARTLGLEVIAEGVETGAQAALLGGLGCHYAQGFHFAGPLTPQAAGEHLLGAARAA